MNAARGYLDLAFFREYACDVNISPTTAAEFFNQFTVRFQARARRFVGQGIQDFSEFGVHGKGLSYFHCTSKATDSHLIRAG
jgi:hypothetical protein